MDYKKIVFDSWHIAQEHTYLQWFAAIPMMAMIIVDMLYIPARWGVKISDTFWSDVALVVDNLYSNYNGFFIAGAVIFGIAFIFYFLLSAFFEGGLIGMISRIIQNDGKPIRGSLGFGYGLKTFGRLLKLHAITAFMNPVIIYIILSLLRDYQRGIYDVLFWPLFILLIVDIFLKLAISYSDYDVVITGSTTMKSIKNSFSIVLFNLKETVFIAFILGLIIARAIISLIIMFIVPVALIWLSTKIVGIASSTIVIAFIVLVCLFIYYYLVKFASLFSVFTHVLWVMTYNKLNETTKEHLSAIAEEQ